MAAGGSLKGDCCDADIVFQRSTDGGITWGAPAQINDETVTTLGTDLSPQLAADGAGNWVALWAFHDYDDPDFLYDVYVSRSGDDGVTWSAPALLGPSAGVADMPRRGDRRRGNLDRNVDARRDRPADLRGPDRPRTASHGRRHRSERETPRRTTAGASRPMGAGDGSWYGRHRVPAETSTSRSRAR